MVQHQCRSYFRCQKQYRYHLTETFHRNLRTNGKRSSTTRSLSEFVSGTSLGSLSNYDGDGSEDGKKAIGLDWQNNNPARASRFFVHFFAINARLHIFLFFFPLNSHWVLKNFISGKSTKTVLRALSPTCHWSVMNNWNTAVSSNQ